MKQFVRLKLWLVLLLLAITNSHAAFWITGYYPGYKQDFMPASNIDFTTVTHVIHFSIAPQANGTVDPTANSLTPAHCINLVSVAHAASAKAIISVGGGGTESAFIQATTAGNLPTFINSITNFMTTYNYDGVDIDWEPLNVADMSQFTNFVVSLRTALNTFSKPKLLTIGASSYNTDSIAQEIATIAAVQSNFDQINFQLYDLAGPYPGWVTWFNSPIYSGGYTFPSSGGLIPSANDFLTNAMSKIPAAKIGFGTAFYGYIWTGSTGVTLPRQSWPSTNPPTITAQGYATIMSGYFHSNQYHYDTVAQAAYLSVTNAVPANDMFISYDDTTAVASKVSYCRNTGLGGMMVWELSHDFTPANPVGQRSPLMQAAKQSLATPLFTAIELNAGKINLSFTSLPLAFYRILWTDNLGANSWNTLTNNVPGTGMVLRVTDTNNFMSAARFYRVQTPP